MNILLTGAAGQLGQELLPLLLPHGHVTATDRGRVRSVDGVNRVVADLADGGELESLLNRLQPRLIVNTAAYTAVDQAESDRDAAFEINTEMPARLARWAVRNEARLLHYSTDYVFDGKAGIPYAETDGTEPLNVYGESKLAGEQAIGSSGCAFAILRTSWVYSSHGKNFVLTMLELARKGIPLAVVNDQRACPTWARNLARASDSVIREWRSNGTENRQGVFHYCDGRVLSWYEFARLIFEYAVEAGLLQKMPELTPVPGSRFPQPAKRPGWSVLDTALIAEKFNLAPAPFEPSLREVVQEIKAMG